jgi:hypothetical protein
LKGIITMLKKVLVAGLIVTMCLFGANAMAYPGNGLHLGVDDNPGNHYGWGDGGDNGPCVSAECYAAGNFDIGVVAIGGGLSADGKLIPNGAAGGIGAAGGVAFGAAEGAFESYKVRKYIFFGPWKTITLGGTEANIGVTAGGMTKTEAYRFNPEVGDIGIGVGSYTHNIAAVHGALDGNAWGLAHSEGFFAGVAGQGSLDGSIVFGSPLPFWKSKGVSYGLTGQGSLGYIYGVGGAAGLGSYELEAGIDMSGYTQSDSWRAVDFFEGGKTEYMGTAVLTNTQVESYGDADDSLIGFANVGGQWVASGFATSKTIQTITTPAGGGFAGANANGAYSGSGGLGCNLNATAQGYTQTSATTLNGYNGSIMSSSAGMKVNNLPLSD